MGFTRLSSPPQVIDSTQFFTATCLGHSRQYPIGFDGGCDNSAQIYRFMGHHPAPFTLLAYPPSYLLDLTMNSGICFVSIFRAESLIEDWPSVRFGDCKTSPAHAGALKSIAAPISLTPNFCEIRTPDPLRTTLSAKARYRAIRTWSNTPCHPFTLNLRRTFSPEPRI